MQLHHRSRRATILTGREEIDSRHYIMVDTTDGIKYCNWLIESNAIEKYNEFEFDKYKEIYQYGYKAMTEYIHSHPEMIETITGKPLEHNHPKAINTKDKIAGDK